MLSRIITIQNKKGLHARAAAKFVKCAQNFQSEIRVCRHGKPVQGDLLDGQQARVSARSILGLMMLGAQAGTPLELSAEGGDAAQALDALQALIEARFEENE